MWITIGIIFVIIWGWVAYETYNAPLMPDDYNTKINKKQLTKNKK